MDYIMKQELITLGHIVDTDGSQEMHKLYVDYLTFTQIGDEEKARMAKAFILARRNAYAA